MNAVKPEQPATAEPGKGSPATSLGARIARRLRRLKPRLVSHFVMTEAVNGPSTEPQMPEGFALCHIQRNQDTLFAELDRFHGASGFGEGWAGEMLERGAEAVAVVANEGPAVTVVGAAWMTTHGFELDEISHTFHPGEHACYFFGTFVAPEYRGRRFHRALIAKRLSIAYERGLKWAHSIVNADNRPALSSWNARHTARSASLHQYRMGPLQIDVVDVLSPSHPHGEFSPEGVKILGLEFRRAPRC